MKIIEICDDCQHPAVKYHNIDRHIYRLTDGREIYSRSCNQKGCNCYRAKILNEEPILAIEKLKLKQILQEVTA